LGEINIQQPLIVCKVWIGYDLFGFIAWSCWQRKCRDLKYQKESEIDQDLELFRNQLRSKVEGELDIDTKKSVLNSLIKKLKVDQDGLVEIDFCVALGNTPYTSWTRADRYAILAPVLLRWKIIRRNVCTAVAYRNWWG